MNWFFRIIKVSALVCFLGNHIIASATAGGLKTTQVLKNVFAVAPQGFSGPNSTFIITEKGVVVIDSGSGPVDAQKILTEIRRNTILPIRFVINTHYYGTHTFGNIVFRKEGAVIISSSKIQRALSGKRGMKELKRLMANGVEGLDRAVVVPANMTFHKRLDFIFGGVYLQLIPQEHGLTDGDTLVVLPDLKTVITGGLVNNEQIPRMEDSHIEDWIKTLGKFDNYRAEIIIPGAGAIGEKPVALHMRHYLLDLKQQVMEAGNQGKELEETLVRVRAFIEDKYTHWTGKEHLDHNIRSAFFEYRIQKEQRQDNHL